MHHNKAVIARLAGHSLWNTRAYQVANIQLGHQGDSMVEACWADRCTDPTESSWLPVYKVLCLLPARLPSINGTASDIVLQISARRCQGASADDHSVVDDSHRLYPLRIRCRDSGAKKTRISGDPCQFSIDPIISHNKMRSWQELFREDVAKHFLLDIPSSCLRNLHCMTVQSATNQAGKCHLKHYQPSRD